MNHKKSAFMSASVVITLDTRRIKKKTGKYPVKLLVTYNGEPQRYQTIYDLTVKEYKNLSASRVSDQMQKVKDSLKEIRRKAEEAISSLEPFSFDDFEKDFVFNNPLFRQRKYLKNKVITAALNRDDFDYTPFYKKFPILTEPPADPTTFVFTFTSYIKKLLTEGRIGTALSCHCAYNSFKRFSGNVTFSYMTVNYLNRYEQWAKLGGISKTTIGIYTRALRTIFNEADANGIIRKEKCYPFGRRKYQVPTSRNKKKALELNHIEQIYYYKPSCESEKKAKAYWLFCYFSNGINPKDVALLKYKNIQEEYIVFERAKTERTSRSDPKPIIVYITEEIAAIIDEFGNKDKRPDNYIFPILYEGVTPLRQYDLVQFFVRFINDWMAKICENLGIDKKATTYVARHSFATVLKRSGASTEVIQEALGHEDIRTTENYLDSFGNDTKKEIAGKLTAFKKNRKDNETHYQSHNVPAESQVIMEEV